MEGGEANTDVAWMARWRATRDGSPRFLCCGRDKQKKGASVSMHRGLRAKGAVGGARSGTQEGQKEGSNDDWGALDSADPVCTYEQQQ
jgi:hypothetical protein